MAPADRPPAQHLSFLLAAGEEARRWGLFPLLRGAEARAPGLPRIGRSRLPAQDVADLAQAPTMAFPNSTLESVGIDGDRARVAGYWLGLTGPMGPLPIHLTEFAVYETRYAKSRPFGQFLDLLSARMLQLFYRAWADSQPAAMADRPDDDRFAMYIGALTGAGEGARADSEFPARARLHYAGLFATRRSASAIEDGLSHLLRQPVRVLEYQPGWREIEVEDRSRLGRSFARLGGEVVLGSKVRSASDSFRVVIRAATLHDYESLLPTGARFAIAAEALDAFTPGHLSWDLGLEIREDLAPPARLDGRSRLGWTSWLRPGQTGRIRRDAHLRKIRRPRATAEGFAR